MTRSRPAARKRKPATRTGQRSARPARRVLLLVATRKGAWLYHGDAARRTWRVDGPHFLGHIVNHLVLDPRDGRTLLAAAKTGHLGPTVFRSTRPRPHLEGGGAAARLPEGAGGREGPRRRSHVLAHAGPRERAGRVVRGHVAAGALPLRRRRRHLGADLRAQRRSAVPDVDGRRAGRHARRAEAALDHRRPARPGAPLPRRCRAAACTNRVDGGRTWTPIVQGLEVVEGFDPANVAFHDPHCVRLCPSNPDRLYQQNHCGIYRLDRPSNEWVRIGQEHAEAGRRHRLPDGRAPARRGDGVGVPDGRHDRLAAHQPRTAIPAPTSRATAARAGSVSTPACRRARPGGR